jgi:phospholipase C
MRKCNLRSSSRIFPSVLLLTAACGSSAPKTSGIERTNHIVVLVLENWSFDSLYAEFPDADGIVNGMHAPPQIDATGAPYATLPQNVAHIPTTLPNAPFPLDMYVPTSTETSRDLTNNFYEEQRQIHGGKMDQFVLYDASAKGLTMGYYHVTDLPLFTEASQYTLCDHFFHGVFGGSLQNHIFLISAAVAQFPNAPASVKRAVLDANGLPVADANGKPQDGPLTPDGFVVGTLFPTATPHPASTPAEQLVPPQTMPTIGDSLTAANIDWAWYAEGWTDITSNPGSNPKLFQYNHQPFAYFENYGDGAPGRAHLKDESEFLAAAQTGKLPAVSFVKPDGMDNEHPNYTDVIAGEQHARALIDAVRNGPNWSDTAIIVTYDENGGFWDHLPPPAGDKWGPGTRVPAIVISPFAKKAFVDTTVYDSASILAFIEHRFHLQPLGTRDQSAADLTNAFDFTQR